MGQENNAKHFQLDKQTGEDMREELEKLLSEYSEFHVDTNRMTFTAENWDKFKTALSEEVEKSIEEPIVEEPEEEVVEEDKVDEEKLALEEEVKRLQKELDEFIESGWEANGNKLYFKGEEQS